MDLKSDANQPCTGGHTSEILTLVSAVNFSRFTPRKYIVSEGDQLSARKAAALELLKTDGAPKAVCVFILITDLSPTMKF
jgi:hypothetical protein